MLFGQPESGPIMSAWVTLMSARRDYVRYGCGGNNYCDSGDCVARASRVKRVSSQQDLATVAGRHRSRVGLVEEDGEVLGIQAAPKSEDLNARG
jgi:hypothetical protein